MINGFLGDDWSLPRQWWVTRWYVGWHRWCLPLLHRIFPLWQAQSVGRDVENYWDRSEQMVSSKKIRTNRSNAYNDQNMVLSTGCSWCERGHLSVWIDIDETVVWRRMKDDQSLSVIHVNFKCLLSEIIHFLLRSDAFGNWMHQHAHRSVLRDGLSQESPWLWKIVEFLRTRKKARCMFNEGKES